MTCVCERERDQVITMASKKWKEVYKDALGLRPNNNINHS